MPRLHHPTQALHYRAWHALWSLTNSRVEMVMTLLSLLDELLDTGMEHSTMREDTCIYSLVQISCRLYQMAKGNLYDLDT
jgi:hypothetical protein